MRYLLHVQSVGKHNDIHRYILSVIQHFSKFLHLVRVMTKSGLSIALALGSTFHNDNSRPRPVGVRKDKSKEFLNKQIQKCYTRRAFIFRCAKIPTCNVRALNMLIGRSTVDCITILLINITTDM